MKEQKESKKSQTSVIVVVIMIVIGIAAAALIAKWVIPLIKDDLARGSIDTNFVLFLDSDNTFYNPESDSGSSQSSPIGHAYVKVSRQAGGSKLYAILISFTSGDESYSYINKNVPGESEARTYKIPIYAKSPPSSVKIFPVVLINGNQNILNAADETTLNTKINFPKGIVDPCSKPFSSSGSLPPNPAIPDDCD